MIDVKLSQTFIETVFTTPSSPKVGETTYISWRTKNWTDVYLEGYWIITIKKDGVLKRQIRYPSTGYSYMSPYSTRLETVEHVFSDAGSHEICVYFYYWAWY